MPSKTKRKTNRVTFDEDFLKKKVEEKGIASQILSLIFVCAVLIGLFYQSYQMVELYFSYQVSTNIKIRLPVIIVPQALSFCTRWTELLDYAGYNRETGNDFQHNKQNETYNRYLQETLTIDQISRFTPNVNQVLAKVWFRKKEDYKVYEIEDKNFLRDNFSFNKYIYLQYVCYKFYLKNEENKTYMSLAATPIRSGMIMMFKFSEFMKKSNFIKVCVHGLNTFPHRTLPLMQIINRHYNESRPAYNEFIVEQSRMTTIGLPSPYETNCIDYRKELGFISEAACAHDCIRHKTLEQLEKFPFNIFIQEDDPETKRRMVSYKDATAGNNSQVIEQIQNECYNQACKRLDCYFKYAMTRTTARIGQDFVIRRILPAHASVYIVSSPKFTLLEFITYTLSVTSTFTGISVIHFNPVKGFQLLCRKIRKCLKHRRSVFETQTSDQTNDPMKQEK